MGRFGPDQERLRRDNKAARPTIALLAAPEHVLARGALLILGRAHVVDGVCEGFEKVRSAIGQRAWGSGRRDADAVHKGRTG